MFHSMPSDEQTEVEVRIALTAEFQLPQTDFGFGFGGGASGDFVPGSPVYGFTLGETDKLSVVVLFGELRSCGGT